jgi:hypothetical protein
VTHTQERVSAAERIAVRCVDSDVHPVPKRGELTQYIPEPWRSKFFLDHRVGELIYYDAPDYAHSYAMRVDTFPPDGEFPGSNPDMAFRQLIMAAGSERFGGGSRVDRGVDRSDGLGDCIAVLAAGIPESAADQMDDAGLYDRIREHCAYRGR